MIRTHKISFARMSNKHESFLLRAYGTRRFAYNRAKSLSDQNYLLTGKTSSAFDLISMFQKEYRDNPEYSWLYGIPKSVCQEAIKDYRKSLQAFFKKTSRMPGFQKKRHDQGSFTLSNQQFSINGRYLKIAKFPRQFKLTTPLRFEGKILRATVSQEGKHHYVAITVDVPDHLHTLLPHTGNAVGVDLNIHSIDDSDGNEFPHEQHLKKDLARLRTAQKELSRKQKSSKNRQKARRKVARIHDQISNRRRDAQHKLSHTIVSNNSVIGVESLNVSGMVKNRILARAISDASFYSFLEKIKYKSLLHNRIVVEVGRFFPSSKLCSQCGSKKTNLTLSDRTYHCDECGLTIRRDLNAAINIRQEALRLLDTNPPAGYAGCVEGTSDQDHLIQAVPTKHEPIINLESIE